MGELNLRRMFLTSSFSDVAEIFQDFEKECKGKTVTFIPTASLVERTAVYIKWEKKALEKLGMVIDELEVSTSSYDIVKEKLEKNDYIFVAGGNTFFLLQEFKKSGADKIIIDQVNTGKLYIGESAGSIITAPSILYSKEMDSIEKAPELKEYIGLGLVDFYTVPHYKNFPFKKAADKIVRLYSEELNLITIGNKQVIIMEGKNKRIEEV